jgi:hypothetical protein
MKGIFASIAIPALLLSAAVMAGERPSAEVIGQVYAFDVGKSTVDVTVPLPARPEIARHPQDTEYAEEVRTSGTFSVKGRVTYLDRSGVERGLSNVSIQIWDDDTGYDDYLAVTISDADGYYKLSSIPVDDDSEWNTFDPYVLAVLDNSAFDVDESWGDSPLSLQTFYTTDVSAGATVNFGTSKFASPAGFDSSEYAGFVPYDTVGLLFASLNNAWQFAYSHGLAPQHTVASVCYDCAVYNGSWVASWNFYINPTNNDAKTDLPYILYGESLLLGKNTALPDPIYGISLAEKSGSTTAFIQGFGLFTTAALYETKGVTSPALTWPNFADGGTVSFTVEKRQTSATGEDIATNVACAWWDLYDRADEAGTGVVVGDMNSAAPVPMANLFSAYGLSYSTSTHFAQYWDNIKGALSSTQRNGAYNSAAYDGVLINP